MPLTGSGSGEGSPEPELFILGRARGNELRLQTTDRLPSENSYQSLPLYRFGGDARHRPAVHQ